MSTYLIVNQLQIIHPQFRPNSRTSVLEPSQNFLSEGVLADTVSQLDNFDVECLDIGLKEETPPNIRDRYCLGEVTVKVPEAYLKRYYSVWQKFRLVEDSSKESISELYWGICVPAACTPQDVKDVVGRVLAVASSESRLKLTPRIPEGFRSNKTIFSVKIVNVFCIYDKVTTSDS